MWLMIAKQCWNLNFHSPSPSFSAEEQNKNFFSLIIEVIELLLN